MSWSLVFISCVMPAALLFALLAAEQLRRKLGRTVPVERIHFRAVERFVRRTEQRVPYFLIVIGALVSILVLVPAGDVNAQQNGAQVARLLKTDIDGTKWDVMTVEVARGKAGARNLHPGAELIYVLEGEGFLEVAGKPPIPLSPGTIAALSPTQRHVLQSMSQTQTMKVLVISLLGKGHPSLPSGNGAPSPSTGGQDDATRSGLVF